MKRIILSIIAAAAVAFSSAAYEYEHSVLVNLTDGTSVEYKFEQIPVLTVVGTDIKMERAATEESVLYPMADVLNFTFEKEKSGVEGIREESSVWFALGDDTLKCGGMAAGTDIRIFDINGTELARALCDEAGEAVLSTASLPKGVYAVSAGKHSFKFTR